jgi:hypothetical protein
VRGHTGNVRFDGETVTIIRKGGLARISVGKGEKQIPLANITAVQFKPAGPVVNGFIAFTVGGGIERRSSFGSQTFSAVDDENSIVFHRGQREQFEKLRDVVQEALATHHRAMARPHHVVTETSIPQQIEQLAALRNSGVLTEEEFEAKKRELLARM